MAEEKSIMDKRQYNLEVLKFAVYLITLIVAVMLSYGSLDRRLTIVEVKQESKVDGKALEEKLQIWKTEIVKELKEEMEKMQVKKGN